MKIQLLTTYYIPFLKSFYDKTIHLKSLSYQQILDKLLDEYFADTGALYHHCALHNLQPFIIIANCEPLQKQWAKENNFAYKESNWEKEIVLAQIKIFKPDVFYIESIFNYYGPFLKQVKSLCKKTIAWISTPFDENLMLNDIDLILSSTPDFVAKFRGMGIKSEYQLPAFDVRVLDKINSTVKKDIPFSFVGGWSDQHINRREALIRLTDSSVIQLWGYGYKQPKYSKRSLKFYSNLLISEKKSKILDVYNGEVWGLEMYIILKRSLVTFNIHEALLNGRVGNMRMFEATGVGTMLMNDNGLNLPEIFIPGKEIETYNTIDEAIEKTNFYLSNPQKAIEIGINAQKRTVSDYNYDNYVLQLIDFLKAL